MAGPRAMARERLHPSFQDDFAPFASRRSVVFGKKGVVAAPNPLATAAGLKILAKGGNAADAAVATGAVLSVVDPAMCGIGGDAFCMFFDSQDHSLKGLNGSGRSPHALTIDKLRELGVRGQQIPLKSLNAVTVPGCCAAWVDTLRIFGSGKVSLQEVLEPAITLAENGFPVSEISAYVWKNSEQFLKTPGLNGHELLLGGRAPQTGELMFNKSLAQCLREIATLGSEGFYKGRIANEIVKLIQANGGLMDLKDLESHTSTPVEPISYTYRAMSEGEVTLHELPPNGQGLTALIALGIFECLEEKGIVDMKHIVHNSAEWLHTLIECLRLAFADTRTFVTDPEKASLPVSAFLEKDYLMKRAAQFDPLQSQTNVTHGYPQRTQETVFFTTSDKEGNACSFIMSVYNSFGTGAIPEGCGFTLQNRGCNFVLDKSHLNCLEPGKRPYHTIIPAMVTRKGELFLSYGVMGAFMQPQGHLQVLLSMIHGGYRAQAALDSPRFCITPPLPDDQWNTAQPSRSHVFLEEGISTSVVDQLAQMGHKVEVLTGHKRALFGRGQIIQKIIDSNSGQQLWAAGSDPRADGHAAVEI